MSDVHLEYQKNGPKYINKLKPTEKSDDILVLAGDIGNPTKKLYKLFIKTMSELYRKVIIISGNHEYYQHQLHPWKLDIKKYGLSMESIEELLFKIADEFDNVHYLQKGELIVDDIRFLGCTMWTPSHPTLTTLMNDYSVIPDMTYELCRDIHRDHKSWLEGKLNECDKEYKKTIVITHHCPSYSLLGKGGNTEPFYFSNLEYLMDKVDYWICGHSHGFKRMTINGCDCIKSTIEDGLYQFYHFDTNPES
jgi:DNA repair exonuclease SbcCD nuclease subunit